LCPASAARGYRWLLAFTFTGALGAVVSAASGGQVESLSVVEADGVYETRMAALLDAPADYVYGVITDYRHIYRINPAIVESEMLPGRDDGTTRVRNRLSHCFAIFCMDIDLVEDVRVIGDRHIVATTVPEQSSFESGVATWLVRRFPGGRARIQYHASIKPDFFIPPLIGTAVMKSLMRREIMNSLARIECLARIVAHHAVEPVTVQFAAREPDARDCAG
jgi:hypothetical protein